MVSPNGLVGGGSSGGGSPSVLGGNGGARFGLCFGTCASCVNSLSSLCVSQSDSLLRVEYCVRPRCFPTHRSSVDLHSLLSLCTSTSVILVAFPSLSMISMLRSVDPSTSTIPTNARVAPWFHPGAISPCLPLVVQFLYFYHTLLQKRMVFPAPPPLHLSAVVRNALSTMLHDPFVS